MDQLHVILPVYNEKGGIYTVLKSWKKELDRYRISYRILVCEDGSTDGTKEILKSVQNKFNLILNQKSYRRSYGGAVIDGIKSSSAEFILCIDSDGQCNPKDFGKFWNRRGLADVIMGWRTKRNDPYQRRVYSSLFKIAFKLLFSTPLHDPSCPFVLFKRQKVVSYIKMLKFLKEGFWWGFVGMCVKKNIAIEEIPIRHNVRLSGTTKVYTLAKTPYIAVNNLIGLIKLKLTDL